MSTTHQNMEQSNVIPYRYVFSPKKQRWLLDGESEPLTPNQLYRLNVIRSLLEDEILCREYNSEIEAELKDILEALYYVIGENNG